MSDAAPVPAVFSEVSRVVRRADGAFDAIVHPGWTIAGKPNGGYLLAILGRAAVSVSGHEHVVAASAHYLRPPDPGPVLVRTEVLRAGRSADQIRARMSQRVEDTDKDCVEALFTVTRLDPDTEPHWDRNAPAPSATSFDESVGSPGESPGGFEVPIMHQIDLRMDAGSMAAMQGVPSGGGELRGWLDLPGQHTFDPLSLLFAVDAFPPATFDIERTGWVPTLELTAYIRALPVPGPVQVLQRANVIEGQRVDEVCWVHDSAGRVVAQATQLAAIRLG